MNLPYRLGFKLFFYRFPGKKILIMPQFRPYQNVISFKKQKSQTFIYVNTTIFPQERHIIEINKFLELHLVKLSIKNWKGKIPRVKTHF